MPSHFSAFNRTSVSGCIMHKYTVSVFEIGKYVCAIINIVTFTAEGTLSLSLSLSYM